MSEMSSQMNFWSSVVQNLVRLWMPTIPALLLLGWWRNDFLGSLIGVPVMIVVSAPAFWVVSRISAKRRNGAQ
jgi:hypothetical protein